MSKNTQRTPAMEASAPELDRPVVTRGVRHTQEKLRRKLARVAGRTLIVGLDLARKRQAVSFAHARQILGRARVECLPQDLGRKLLPLIQALQQEHGLERVVIGLEPAGHYWALAAEGFEALGLDYVLVHTLSVKREREVARYTPEKTDPGDADLVTELVGTGRFTEARLFASAERAQLNALAREYLLLRKAAAAERTRLHNFWDRLLPEVFDVLSELESKTALAISRALLPFSQLACLSEVQWWERVKAQAGGRILKRATREVLQHIQAAHLNPHRRAGEGMPLRIQLATERWRLLDAQKEALAAEILRLYDTYSEAVYLDSIPGSHRLYNALTLGLVGDFRLYDHSRSLVKLAGSEVNEYASGDWQGTSRISHRGRTLLRAAAYQQARNLVLKNEIFRARYFRLQRRATGRCLSEQQAYVAIANSYLRTAHALVLNQTPWAPPQQ